MCVCVCVYRLIYPGGDFNRNTHRLTVGTKIKVPMGTKANKSYRIRFFVFFGESTFFFKLKLVINVTV